MVVVSANTGAVELMTSTVEVNMARRQTPVAVSSYVEFVEEPIVAGVNRLLDLDGDAGTVAIETGYLPADRYQRLLSAGLGPTYRPLGEWFTRMRQIKDEREIAVLTDLGRATESIVADAFAAARAGDTERGVYNALLRGVHDRGHALSHATLAAGGNVSRSHHRADDTVLSNGDLVRVDMGVASGGYLSDIARMAVVGEPSPLQTARYRHVVDAERRMIDRFRPGVDTRAVFAQWRQRLEREAASTSMALIAHGIGLALHEDPQVDERSSWEIQPGMVLCVEPMVEYPDGEVYHVEDLILVTEDSPRYLTDPSGADTLTIIPGEQS